MTVITATDLNAFVTNDLASVIADKELVTRSHQLSFQFKDFFDTTAESLRQRRFVVPRSCFVETVFAYGYDYPSPYNTMTVDITGDGALVNWPINMSHTFSSTTQNFNRTLFNNASTKYRDRGFRVLPQGSTVTLTVSTTRVSGGSNTNILTVGLVLRQFYGR
jgi:hypothetical protein